MQIIYIILHNWYRIVFNFLSYSCIIYIRPFFKLRQHAQSAASFHHPRPTPTRKYDKVSKILWEYLLFGYKCKILYLCTFCTIQKNVRKFCTCLPLISFVFLTDNRRTWKDEFFFRNYLRPDLSQKPAMCSLAESDLLFDPGTKNFSWTFFSTL